MLIQHNYLRLYRKRSSLTQSDVAHLLELPDYSNISRWEQGLRKPAVHTLLIYHNLFNVPIEAFFERQKRELEERLTKRIIQYLNELKSEPLERKIVDRIESLKSILKRLSPSSIL